MFDFDTIRTNLIESPLLVCCYEPLLAPVLPSMHHLCMSTLGEVESVIESLRGPTAQTIPRVVAVCRRTTSDSEGRIRKNDARSIVVLS